MKTEQAKKQAAYRARNKARQTEILEIIDNWYAKAHRNETAVAAAVSSADIQRIYELIKRN